MTDNFRECHVVADGFRIRCLEAGDGPVLLHLHGAGGARWSPAHDLLARRFRVILLEMPGFGAEENTRTWHVREMAGTVAKAAAVLGLPRYGLMATSFGARVALWLAEGWPGYVTALVLEAPAAIRPDAMVPLTGTPDDVARRVYAHPERMPPLPAEDPARTAWRTSLLARVWGSPRDLALESTMAELRMPVLVVFGTRDTVIPPDIGRKYLDLIPDAQLAFVYDAGHDTAMERPEAFAEIVGDFLTRGAAFSISEETTSLFP